MKTLNLTSLALAALLFASTSCRKSTSSENNSNPEKSAQEFVKAAGPKMQSATITLSATAPQVITLSGGTKLSIPAGAFTVGGVPVTGQVTVMAMEVLKRSSVLLSGTNTNHIDGSPLASDGFIYIDVKANGVSVDHNLTLPIQVSIPAKRAGVTNLWEGVNAATGAPLDSVKAGQQMAWAAPRAVNGPGKPQEVSPVSNFYNFNMGTTGWINCDVFYSYANPKTTVNVSLINNPGTLASFHALGGETFVFFCAKGTNVCAQLYTTTSANSVKSYDDSMPIGVQGKMMSFSIKDGRYYYAESEVTITAGLSLSLTLAETSEAQVQAALTSLDTY